MKKSSNLLPGFLAVFVLIFIAVALLVPDDSIFKQMFGYLTGTILVAMFIWLTPLGNPLKRFLKKIGILK
jgi:hypothetical protein